MKLADVVPDGEVLVALHPEELGLRILQHSNPPRSVPELRAARLFKPPTTGRNRTFNKRGVGRGLNAKGSFCKTPATCREICPFSVEKLAD